MRDLNKRKKLASKVLGVGKNKIWFDNLRLAEIKEAITKQDIRDLFESGLIRIKPSSGRKTIVKRKTRRGPGKIKWRIKNTKGKYVIMTRKLRNHLKTLRRINKIDTETYLNLRKKIKAKMFKDKAHLKEHIKEMKK